MKALILHHLALVLQQVHAQLQVRAAVDVRRHDLVVGAVQQYLAQQPDGLPLRHVALRLHQDGVVLREEQLKVDVQVIGEQRFMFG